MIFYNIFNISKLYYKHLKIHYLQHLENNNTLSWKKSFFIISKEKPKKSFILKSKVQ
jgi:hypothetical protein